MKLLENKSQIWFKVLTNDGRSTESLTEFFPLPDGSKKAKWFTSSSELGTWLVSNPKQFIQKTHRLFIAELDEHEPIAELPGVIWVKRVRLIREANNLDLKPFGVYRAFGPMF